LQDSTKVPNPSLPLRVHCADRLAMRADEAGGRNFYSHLRDAYEALDVGNRPEAERSIRAALHIDPCALAVVEWWSYLRAESVLTAAGEAERATFGTEFDAPTTVERWDDECATV